MAGRFSRFWGDLACSHALRGLPFVTGFVHRDGVPSGAALCGRFLPRLGPLAERWSGLFFAKVRSRLTAPIFRRPLHSVHATATRGVVFRRDCRMSMLVLGHTHVVTVQSAGIVIASNTSSGHIRSARTLLNHSRSTDACVWLAVCSSVGRSRILIGGCCADHASCTAWAC